MEILNEVIEKLKDLEDHPGIKQRIFPIRRLVESEKVRQLKQGTRIKVKPLSLICEYCPQVFLDPEQFYLHLVQKHICPADEARKQLDEQQQNYLEDINKLEDLTQQHTEVMLDVDYTDEIRDT